jgi:sulfonate transport system permease protein
MKRLKNALRNILGSGGVLPVLLLAGWAAAVHLGFLDVRIWSSPELVIRGGWTALQDGSLLAALAASLERDLIGFGIGAGLGLPLGLLLARVRLADRLLSPTLNATRQVALFAWVPFLSLWLGNGEEGRIAFIALASFFPVLLNSHLGAVRVEARHLEVGRILCLRPHRLLLKVILPSALPSILTGLRLGLIYAWLATIGAEYLFSTTTGIGSLMMDARDLFRMDLVILGMIVIGGVGFVLNILLSRIAHLPLSRGVEETI